MKGTSKVNLTTLKHDTVRLKIAGAMRNSMNKGYAHYVSNRKGELYLRVERVQGAVTGHCFKFIQAGGKDVTEVVYRGLAA